MAKNKRVHTLLSATQKCDRILTVSEVAIAAIGFQHCLLDRSTQMLSKIMRAGIAIRRND